MTEELSPEFLFYHAAVNSTGGDPSRGTTFAGTASALLVEGQPNELEWPYTSHTVLPWSPPTILGPIYKADVKIGKMSFSQITAAIDKNRPIILGIVMTDGFRMPNADGVVADEIGDIERGGHAILAVGHGTVNSQPAILIRNSWGDTWGDGGHAWLTQTYIDQHLHETAHLL